MTNWIKHHQTITSINRSQDISATMKPLATPAARSLPTWLCFCWLLHVGILGLQKKQRSLKINTILEIHALFTPLLLHFFPLISFDINARGFPRLKNIQTTHAHSEFWCILGETTFASSLRPSPQNRKGWMTCFIRLKRSEVLGFRSLQPSRLQAAHAQSARKPATKIANRIVPATSAERSVW